MTDHKLTYRVLLCLIVLLALTSLTFSLPLQAQGPEEPRPLINDALIPPPSRRELAVQEEGGPPDFHQTSEYMAGRVAVGVILPESNGAADPSSEDWTDAQIAEVEAEIVGALKWWTEMLPNAHLSFTYELRARVPTSYEPIIHSAMAMQELWVSEAMASLGYEGPDWDYFDRIRAYLNDLREAHEADWAFTVFVVNSAADPDGLFADYFFAYAYLGGPFTVLTYDNDGYGTSNIDAVLAHEMGHVFWALDQYEGARVPCDARSGYLDIPNYNSEYGDCPSDVPSIMRGGSGPYAQHAIDPYAQGQVGYWDSDRDGLPDPLDTVPSLVLPSASPDKEGRVSYTGAAEDVPFPSPTHRDTTINTIVDVEYRVDGGPWQSASPADGQFDSFLEPFAFTVAPGGGTHTIEARAVNSVGNFSEVVSDTIFIEGEPICTPTPELPTPTPTHTPQPPTPTPTHTPQPPTPTPTHTPQPPTPTPTPTLTPSPTPDPNANMIINDGAKYTDQITVTLTIQPPAGATKMEVSNYPDFSSAAQLLVAYTLTWTVEEAEMGGPRTVYIRFKDGDGRFSATYEDSIILDVQPPTGSVSVHPQGEGTILLHLPASDDLSGVQQMCFGCGEGFQEDDWTDYQPLYEVPDEGAVAFYVRYRDGASNVSDPYRGVNPAYLGFNFYLPLGIFLSPIPDE